MNRVAKELGSEQNGDQVSGQRKNDWTMKLRVNSGNDSGLATEQDSDWRVREVSWRRGGGGMLMVGGSGWYCCWGRRMYTQVGTSQGAMYSIAAAHLTLRQALLDILHIGKAYRPVHTKD